MGADVGREDGLQLEKVADDPGEAFRTDVEGGRDGSEQDGDHSSREEEKTEEQRDEELKDKENDDRGEDVEHEGLSSRMMTRGRKIQGSRYCLNEEEDSDLEALASKENLGTVALREATTAGDENGVSKRRRVAPCRLRDED